MDIATIIGLVMGFGLVILGIWLNADLKSYMDVPSVVIVGGGVIATTFASFPLMQVFSVVGVVKNAFFAKPASSLDTVDILVRFAEMARREGILSLENAIEEVEDPFLRNGIRLAVDGVEPDLIRDILQTELAFVEDRHKLGQSIFESMGTFAPAFGMIGTLIGLVGMLQNLEDVNQIGPNMAVALLTTLYGAMAANIVFLPIAGKLKFRSAEEILHKEVTIEGIMSIQSGDNPRIVEQKLLAFLAPKVRASRSTEGSGTE